MGNRVLVIGAARSGLAGAEFLAKHGQQVVLSDMKKWSLWTICKH